MLKIQWQDETTALQHNSHVATVNNVKTVQALFK